MENRKLGMGTLGYMILKSGNFMHRRENLKNNWQTSLPQPSCWHYSPPPISFIISFLFLGIGLCSHGSRIFFRDFVCLFNFHISFLIYVSSECHFSCLKYIQKNQTKTYKPNVCLSHYSLPPFPQRTQILWYNTSYN